MPTPDPTNVLFKIAHPDLYVCNPFNLLSLPIDATARDIRRRREDVEAAFEAGTEAEEFRHVLPLDASRKAPTLDAVHEAFDALNDPELRIAYSLFWFWPDPETGNRNYERLFTHSGTVAQWREKTLFLKQCPEKTELEHNLAVFHHLMALGYEEHLLTDEAWRDASPEEVLEKWKSAIRYWNKVAQDAEAWHIAANIVSTLKDPRLDYRFARSLRDQFAFAFDQINVELAIAFAKAGRAADAKRQVEYMKLSQPEADDVEGTFDDAFAGLQRQVEAIVKAAREETGRNPKSGLARIDEILERTRDPVQISRIVFEKGAPIRESIVTTIFAGVRNCMIAYGNETKDWDGCLRYISALKTLAENNRQRTAVAEDEKIIAGNKKYQDEEETCWFCKHRYDSVKRRTISHVNLWGEMKAGASYGQVTFSKKTVSVSICSWCAPRSNLHFIGGSVPFDPGLNHMSNISEHPAVKSLLKEGWHLGTEPSQKDIRTFLGIPEPPDPPKAQDSSKEESPIGCIVIGIIIAILLAIANS